MPDSAAIRCRHGSRKKKRKGHLSAQRVGAQRANELLSYLDIEKRPYIHLLDGGLSDNMALRGLIEGATVMGGVEHFLKEGHLKNVRKFVVLAVNAETSPDVLEYRSDHIPVFSKATGAMVDVPINRYSFDTITLLRQGVENVRLRLRSTPRTADSPFAPDADVYFINARSNEVDDPDERLALMKIPTTMYLTDPQIDRLLLAASRLIRRPGIPAADAGYPNFPRTPEELREAQGCSMTVRGKKNPRDEHETTHGGEHAHHHRFAEGKHNSRIVFRC